MEKTINLITPHGETETERLLRNAHNNYIWSRIVADYATRREQECREVGDHTWANRFEEWNRELYQPRLEEARQALEDVMITAGMEPDFAQLESVAAID